MAGIRMNVADFRASLIDHVGGDPNPVQEALIERAILLRAHLGRMDRQMLGSGTKPSAAENAQYLAWTRQLTSVLKTLGVKRAETGEAKPSLADVMGSPAS